MVYPFKYPELYAELARQGKTKAELANSLKLTRAGLSYKQTQGDFTGDEMRKAANFLGKPVSELFDFRETG